MSNNCTPNNTYDETKICERRIKTKNKPLKLRYLIKYNFVADPFNNFPRYKQNPTKNTRGEKASHVIITSEVYMPQCK